MEKKSFNMNEFFGKVKDGVVKGANVVADGSEKLVEKGMTKVSILKLQDAKRDKIMELGKIFYEMYQAKDPNMGKLYDICNEINELEKEIEKKKEEE